MLNTMPSIQTRADPIGATEKRPTHACEPCHSGNTSATARHSTNSTTNAAENAHPSATTFNLVVSEFIGSSLRLQPPSAAEHDCCRRKVLDRDQDPNRSFGGRILSHIKACLASACCFEPFHVR